MKGLITTLLTPLKELEMERYEFKLGFWKSIGVVLAWDILRSALTASFIEFLPTDRIEDFLPYLFIPELIFLPLIAYIFKLSYGKDRFIVNRYKKVNINILAKLFLLILTFRLLYDAFIFPFVCKLSYGSYFVSDEALTNNSYIYLILSACIVAPIIEEFIFRGIVFAGLLNKFSPKIALLLSSFIFAAAHMNIPQAINAFILALIIGNLYYKTRSIYLCIFCHFVNNVLGIFMYLPKSKESLFIYIIITILFSIPALLFLYKTLKLQYNFNFDKDNTIINYYER